MLNKNNINIFLSFYDND